MPITRPTLQTLINRISGDIEGGIGATAPLLASSVLTVLARVFAASCHLLWGYLSFIAQQVMPDTAEAEFLERWAAIYGIYRNPATYAAGEVQVSGTNTTVVPAGTVFIAAGGTEYASAADQTIALGVATCNITALTPGSVGSLANGQVINLLQPIAGVNSAGVVQAAGLIPGNDAETDSALRTRLLERIQNPPQGGSLADYIEWMLANPTIAVLNCWAYGDYGGAGTVGVTFSIPGGGGPVPSGGQVTAMQAYLDVLAPVTAEVICFAPTLVSVACTIHISPDTTALRAAVSSSLADYFTNSGAPGTTLYLSQINEAIASVPGIVDHTLTVPAASVVLTNSQIAALGVITWT
jgi:uncharacterized phage protein gp47/JayE